MPLIFLALPEYSYPNSAEKLAGIQSANYPQEIIDKLLSGYKMRMGLFENMGAVADVTELVRPKLKQAWKEGQQLGRQEGLYQAAKGMKKAGVAADIICKTTGLTQAEIDKLWLRCKRIDNSGGIICL